MKTDKNQYIPKTLVAVALFLFAACSANQSREEHSESEHAENDDIELTTEQVDQAGIKTGTFSYRSLGKNIEANGTIELPPNNLASISVPMEGFVEEIRFLEGAQVKKGQPLVVLKHPAYIQLQQDYFQAESQLTFLKQELARQKTLTEAKVSAKKNFQKTESEYNTARAKVNALKEKLKFLGISSNKVLNGDIQSLVYLVAPFAGTVTKLNAHRGQLVTPKDVIMEVIDREHMHVELQVFQRDILKVKEGQKILFTVPAFENANVYEGEVSLVGKSLDLNTKTIRVHGHFEELDILIPGLYVEAQIVTESHLCRSLPEEAVVRDKGKYYYFTRSGQEGQSRLFQKVEIQPGITDMSFTEIVRFDNHTDTSNIVTKGAFYLKSEMNKGKGDQDD